MELIINRKDCKQLADSICCGEPVKLVVNLDGTKDCIVAQVSAGRVVTYGDVARLAGWSLRWI